MRISDWSSDVCSSDLAEGKAAPGRQGTATHRSPHGQPDHALPQIGEEPKKAPHQAGLKKIAMWVAQASTGCTPAACAPFGPCVRSEEHTSELQSLMRISYAVFCLKKKTTQTQT